MNADAVAAEAKLLKLSEAGTQSWSVLTAALTETRATFDRANQALREHVERRPETLEQTLRRVLREELPKARRTKR